jgi:hypothetical protein
MNKDNRISTLPEALKLNASQLADFPTQFVDTGSDDDDALFLVAKAGIKNEKINFKNLKSSILDSSVLLTGDQSIAGEKTFQNTVNFNAGIFANNLFVKNVDGEWQQVSQSVEAIALPEETVGFNSELTTGSRQFTIDFPKTFAENPIVSATLQTNGPHVPYSISSVSTAQYIISFSSELPTGFEYSIYTLARPTGTSLLRQTKTLSFSQDLEAGLDTFNISFSESFEVPPIISLGLETSGEIIPFSITSVNEQGFSVKFAAQIQTSTKLHIQATR